MWRAINNLIGLLPGRARPAAVAALIICGVLVAAIPGVIPLLDRLPDSHWAASVILGALAALPIMIALLAFLVVAGVVMEFFRGL